MPIVEVRIWRQAVGAVALDPRLGYYASEYQPAFVRSGIELAPLAMRLSAATQPFVFTDLPEQTYRRLPGMLADALPDDFGNALIDAWMARSGVAKSQITSLDRLAYMGKRAMGALKFKPALGPKASKPSTAIDLLEAADRFGIGTAPQVLQQVNEAVASWPEFAGKANVSVPEVVRIKAHLQPLTA